MIYIPFFIVILIDKRDDKKEQLTEGTDTSTVIGTRYKVQVPSTRNKDTSTRYQYKKQVPDTRYKYQVPETKVQGTSTETSTDNTDYLY